MDTPTVRTRSSGSNRNNILQLMTTNPPRTEAEYRGLEGFIDVMLKADDITRDGAIEALTKIDRLFTPATTQETPKRTGKLANSTDGQFIRSGELPELHIVQLARNSAGSLYGHFVREGTKPHEIRPRPGGTLAFEIDGRVVFAKVVQHPGTAPNPYHERVWNRLSPRAQDILNEVGVELQRFAARRIQETGGTA